MQIKKIISEENKIMDKNIDIINNTEESRKNNGMNYEGFDVLVKPQDLIELTNNKCLAININSEYVVFIHM